MIHINKRQPIASFDVFVRAVKPKKWCQIHSYQNDSLYRSIRKEILETEQNGIGGYTECPLLESQADIHIDHYKKQALFPEEIFNWNNFIVENRSLKYGACYKDNQLKNQTDYNLLLNPVVDYPETMLTYRPDGLIEVKSNISQQDKMRAEYTIKTFNLNESSLQKRRLAIIQNIFSYKGLSDDEVRTAMIGCGFPSVVEWALLVR
jgi:uncharacterized protein (TIGR02646 family)